MKCFKQMLYISLLIGAPAAHADNPTIENALAKRPDLSSFYQALMETGVNHELKPGRPYSVFAPTNAAFARVSSNDNPCLYDDSCVTPLAQIVRNHIVPGELHINDAVTQRGGVYAIDGRFINIGEPVRNNYTIDGERVLSASQHGRSLLYKIDGVIASPDERAALQYPPYTVTSVHEHVVPQPAPCLNDGCPQSVKRTTTITMVGPWEPAE